MKNTLNNSVKGRFFLHLISLLVFLSGLGNALFAQFSGDFYGKTVIGCNPTQISGNLTLKSTGELYVQTNRLILNGNYTGDNGSKVYLSVTDNSNITGTKGFIDIFGTANQSGGVTTIELDLFDDWDGSTIDLIRADREGSDINAFYMEETEYGNPYTTAVLLNRIEGNSLIWYIAQKEEPEPIDECLDLIEQKLNNTLVVNNNPATNGGYSFAYYTWFKNGVRIAEGNHDDLNGHHYTGGAGLDPYSEYWVELIDIQGNRHISCPFTPTVQTLSANLRAYPNPVRANATHTVTVEIDGVEEAVLQTATIDVFSAAGALIDKVSVEGRSFVPVEMPEVAGAYLLQFKSNTGNKGIKIIVE